MHTRCRFLAALFVLFAVFMAWALHGRARAEGVAARDVLEHRQSIRSLVSAAARRHGVPEAVAHALIARESGYRVRAVGRSGEIGLGQIRLSTARALGFRGTRAGLFNPSVNLDFAMRYARLALARGSIGYYRRGVP